MKIETALLKILPFWNKDFAKECSIAFDREFTSKGELLHYWGTDLISNVVLAGIVIATLIEMGVTIYRTINYGTEKRR